MRTAPYWHGLPVSAVLAIASMTGCDIAGLLDRGPAAANAGPGDGDAGSTDADTGSSHGGDLLDGGAEPQPATRFVRKTQPCKDSGDGPATMPWCSVGYAGSHAQAGDVVEIAGGSYGSLFRITVSGQRGAPIVFRAVEGETVILGDEGAGAPTTEGGGVIDLAGVSYVVIEALTVRNARGWGFARDCDHIALRNNHFEDALNDGKGNLRFNGCDHVVITGNTFINGYDNINLINTSDSVIEDNVFDVGRHTVVAMRCSSHNVVRRNVMRNTYGEYPEKLMEIYDCKAGPDDPTSPVYVPGANNGARYDSAKFNLVEENYFGFHPWRTNKNAQPSAIQFSGQFGIIRNNVFHNPPVANPNPKMTSNPGGGIGMNMRWGGSASEGPEAMFNHDNRLYHNVFVGYDNGSAVVPNGNGDTFDPPGLSQPARFDDNLFKNNIFAHASYNDHSIGGQELSVYADGKPTHVLVARPEAARFVGNVFFSPDFSQTNDELIVYFAGDSPAGGPPDEAATAHPESFADNWVAEPHFRSLTGVVDLRLEASDALLDEGAFLTSVEGAPAGKEVSVGDARFFFAAAGVERYDGAQGVFVPYPWDVVRFEGKTDLYEVRDVNVQDGTLTLGAAPNVTAGTGVSLAYEGAAPPVGLMEGVPRLAYP